MPLSNTAALAKDRRTGLAEMQHRHLATIAEIIRRLAYDGTMSPADSEIVADHFARELRKTNPRFNAARFLAACKQEA